MSGHDAKTATDVSAVLVKLRDPAAGFQMDMLYNKRGNRLTLAWPIGAMLAKLFDKIAWVDGCWRSFPIWSWSSRRRRSSPASTTR